MATWARSFRYRILEDCRTAANKATRYVQRRAAIALESRQERAIVSHFRRAQTVCYQNTFSVWSSVGRVIGDLSGVCQWSTTCPASLAGRILWDDTQREEIARFNGTIHTTNPFGMCIIAIAPFESSTDVMFLVWFDVPAMDPPLYIIWGPPCSRCNLSSEVNPSTLRAMAAELELKCIDFDAEPLLRQSRSNCSKLSYRRANCPAVVWLSRHRPRDNSSPRRL
jgi:hypothetical protein